MRKYLVDKSQWGRTFYLGSGIPITIYKGTHHINIEGEDGNVLRITSWKDNNGALLSEPSGIEQRVLPHHTPDLFKALEDLKRHNLLTEITKYK